MDTIYLQLNVRSQKILKCGMYINFDFEAGLLG